MLEQVEYIKSIFKIDTDNPYVITDIADELVKIDSFDDFRAWIKVSINHLDAQYMNPFQKFNFLIRLYLKQRLEFQNKERITKGHEYAIELANKVKQISHYVIEHTGATYKNFKTKNGEDAFSSFEQSQLEKVGGLFAAVRLQKSISGVDALADRLEELAYDLIVTNIIEYKPQKKTDKNVAEILSNVMIKM